MSQPTETNGRISKAKRDLLVIRETLEMSDVHDISIERVLILLAEEVLSLTLTQSQTLTVIVTLTFTHSRIDVVTGTGAVTVTAASLLL